MTPTNFLDKLTGKKEAEPKTFLALVLSDHRVQAAVWKVVGAETEIVSLGTPVEWDGDVATTSELISAVDATISSATEGLDLDPEEVVLGLANAWVDPSGIKPSKKDLIKSICRELSLKPIGYVVIADTIVKYLKMQEGAPPTSILIQVDRRSVTLSLVELGGIKYTTMVGASDDISGDVAEALANLPQDISLPSRFILVSAMENASDLVQALTAYDWQKSFDFLHTPKIEALPKDVEVHATAVAGGSEVAASLGFSLEPEPASPTPPPVTANDEAEASSSPEEPKSPPHPPSPADVGFHPVASTELSAEITVPTLPQESNLTEPEFEEPAPAPRKLSLPSLPTLPRLNLKLPSLPRWSLPLRGHGFLFGGILLLALAALALAYYFIPQATVTLTVAAKPLTETIQITLDREIEQVDVAKAAVPARYSSSEISGEETVPVTGTKTIGDPARGEVTVYNRTLLPKTFTKGTTLTANSLKFTLDSDVTVASKSSGADYVDVPGKANVKVTAVSFGTAGNLKAGTELTIANFTKDSFVAKNDAALSGGTSQEVTVVSESDKAALLKSLKTKLAAQLRDSFLPDQDAGANYFILEDDVKIVSEKYSHKIGEAADSLSADVTISLGVLTYNQSDVQQLIGETVETSVPSGYTRAAIPPTISLRDTVKSGDNIQANADITLYVTPILDEDAITQTIKGKNFAAATGFLSTQSGVVNTQIVLKPNLPPRLVSLPANAGRITLKVTTIK